MQPLDTTTARSAGEHSRTIRLLVMTAWLALAVPAVGLVQVAFVVENNPSITSTSTDAMLAFFGGAAIGLALWIVLMLIVLRRNRHDLRIGHQTIWLLLVPWLPALGTWFLLRGPISGGAGAGLAVVVLLSGWFMVWSRATDPLR